MLLTANHAKKDIPEIVKPLQIKYPHIVFSYGKPFGIHQKLIAQIYERIEEQTTEITSDAEILLIGRGSSRWVRFLKIFRKLSTSSLN